MFMDILKLNLGSTKPSAPTGAEICWRVGLLGALIAIAVNVLARFTVQAPLVPELMTDFIFRVVPISIVELAVNFLGTFAKHFAFIGCLVIYGAVLAACGVAFLQVRRFQQSIDLLALSLVLWLVTVLALIPLLGGGVWGRNLRPGATTSSLWLLVVHLVFGSSLAFLSKLYVEDSEANSGKWRPIVLRLDRRKVMTGIGYAVVGAAVYDIIARPIGEWFHQSRKGQVTGGSGVFPNIDGLAREVSPTSDFYQVSKNAFDPDVDIRHWRLVVQGLVENPLSLTYDEIKRWQRSEEFATLECISNTVGGKLIDNASWRGVKLKEILERARLKSGVTKIVLHASDNYADSITLERAMQEGTILAYEMNGAPLNPTHGFPLRLIVPGIYGMKNVKWITRIEAVDYDFKGYWQARGWDDKAEYKTMSRIDVPRKSFQGSTTVAGIAFAGDRGISKVEISTDRGETWEPAVIKTPLSRFTWVLWHREWKPKRTGNFGLMVRATDGNGIVQTADEEPPLPDGASGYHRRNVKVG